MPGGNIKTEEKMVKTKKRGKLVRRRPYVVTIACLAILSVEGIGFGVTGMVLNMQARQEIADLKKDQGEDENVVVEKETFSAENLLVRGDKVIGNDDAPVNVYLDSKFGAIGVALQQKMAGTFEDCDTKERREQGNSKLVVSVDWDAIKEVYDIDEQRTSREEIEIANIDTEHIVDVLATGFGDGMGYGMILILMDDGTVEYIPINKAVKEGFRSYGKIEGVEDVVRIRTVSFSEGCGGKADVIAQKANGELYDLYPMLVVMGVWK